ncbi:epidermal retinol dehydrogenase 2 [Nilaparvata lugens]|uniref:epidermal retinol dehydrogenase 2 n=1 Tax=Nilaparvata lugens TaxID=108931 RepID=UPI000B99BA46|nr:epidermal retinol dehydrogenase 2 [Nilaparvata lugens]
MADSSNASNSRQNNDILMKIYFVSILLLDVSILLVKIMFGIIESIYLKFVPPPEKSVTGEIIAISGSGHGIGRELALQFASLGATIVCIDINEPNNKETVKMISERGYPTAHSFICDVSSRENVLALGKEIKEKVGDVTILINNAGIMPCHPFQSHSEQEIKKMFDINVFAHFWMLEVFLPSMIEKNHGHIVGISSMAGILGLKNLVPYCASKFAVRGMLEALAEELREDPRNLQIKFTGIFPYMVDTGLCKRPKVRFPSLLGLVPPPEAARQIVTAVRRESLEVSIPSHLLFVNNLFRLFPVKVCRLMKDFLDSGCESHD